MDDVGNFFDRSMGHRFSTSVGSINKKTTWSVDKQLEWNRDTLESGDGFKQRKLETEDRHDAPNLIRRSFFSLSQITTLDEINF